MAAAKEPLLASVPKVRYLLPENGGKEGDFGGNSSPDLLLPGVNMTFRGTCGDGLGRLAAGAAFFPAWTLKAAKAEV